MIARVKSLTQRLRHRLAAYFDRTFGGIAVISVHEVDVLSGHWAEVRERVVVARKARGVGELIRDQVDLLPETRLRLARNRRVRRDLWKGLVQDLRQVSRRAFAPRRERHAPAARRQAARAI